MTSVKSYDKVTASAARQCLSFSLYERVVGQFVSNLCEQCGPIVLCVCGEVTLASQRRSITPLNKKAYHLYYGCKLGDQDKKWALHIVCESCAVSWRLPLDSSKVSLKAVLLHNGNVLPSIPIADAFGIKERNDSIKQLPQYIKYDTCKWNICADLKVIALLLGLQLRYTKFPCFPYEWDSRDEAHHYVKRIWPARKILEPGHKNIKHHSLDESSRILLRPLHIKLGLMKNFVKAMDHNGTAFLYLWQ